MPSIDLLPLSATSASSRREKTTLLRLFQLSWIAVLVVVTNFKPAFANQIFSNPGFEVPAAVGSTSGMISDLNAGGWKTTHPSGPYCGGPGACRPIEFWANAANGVPSGQGAQHIELNAFFPSMVFQPVALSSGDVLTWSFLHRGRVSSAIPDVAEFRIGIPSGLPPGSLPPDSYAFSIVRVSTTNNGTFTTPTGSGTINPAVGIGNGWVQYSGIYTYTGPPGTVNIGFVSVSAAGQDPGLGNFIDGVNVDRAGSVGHGDPINPCCPPWDSNKLAAMMFYQGSGGISAPYTVVFQPTAAFKTQIHAYIQYLYAVNPAITAITINFALYNQGTPPVPSSVGNGTLVGTNYYATWTQNSSNNIQPVYSPSYPFFPGYPMQAGVQYLVHTGIYLEGGQRFFSNECANNDIYVTLIAPGPALRGANGSAVFLEIKNRKGQTIRRIDVRNANDSRQRGS